MLWYKRLRYRLIGIQFLVVLIAMGVMLLATRAILLNIPAILEPLLQPYLDAPTLAGVEAQLTVALRNTLLSAVGIASIGSLIAGAIASLLLWRTLVVPLRTLATSSQRIANGRYDKRVPFPDQSGEAMQQLATNFNQMAEQLQQVERQRIELIGNVAHELRTPLSGLQGVVEGLEDGVFATDAGTFGMMGREIGRLSRLVDDIQNLSRVEAGGAGLAFETVVVHELVQRVIMQLQPHADDKQVSLTLTAAATPLVVQADPDRAVQIVTNLVSNAIRYTPADGAIHITLAQTATMASIVVQDTGIGIAAADLPYVFERFFRADRSRSRQSGGSGIGLTIARHLAWGMGGEISAESAGLDQGSTFTLTLPLA